jgi:hypothetical protein
MDNRKPESVRHGVGTIGAPPPRAISGAPPPRAISGAPRVGTSSAPPPHGSSGSERAPPPNPPLTAKTCRQPFVVPAPRLTEGAPVPSQDASSADGVLPQQLLDEMVDPSTMVPRGLALPPPVPVFATASAKAPLPCGCIDDLRAGQAHLLSHSSFSMPNGLLHAWDNQSSSSTLPLPNFLYIVLVQWVKEDH